MEAEKSWVEAIATSLVTAWEEEPSAFKSREDVRAFVLQAMKEMNIPPGSRRWVAGAVFRRAEVQEILTEIRWKQVGQGPFKTNTPLKALPFSTRAIHCLGSKGIKTLGGLLNRLAWQGKNGLLAIRNLGRGTNLEILWVLHRLQIDYGEDEADVSRRITELLRQSPIRQEVERGEIYVLLTEAQLQVLNRKVPLGERRWLVWATVSVGQQWVIACLHDENAADWQTIGFPFPGQALMEILKWD